MKVTKAKRQKQKDKSKKTKANLFLLHNMGYNLFAIPERRSFLDYISPSFIMIMSPMSNLWVWFNSNNIPPTGSRFINVINSRSGPSILALTKLGILKTKAYFGPLMKTLIIHPEDPTTDFLSQIYAHLPNKTIVKGGIRKPELWKLIEGHDMILLPGHGSPWGLLNLGQFPEDLYIIDESMVLQDNLYKIIYVVIFQIIWVLYKFVLSLRERKEIQYDLICS